MSQQPSIKGTAFGSVLEDVRALIDEGRLSREAVEARLDPEHVALLDEKAAPARWYPIACYARLLDVLAETLGGGQRESYLFLRGAVAAERLHAANIYPQLDASGEHLGLRVLPLVISLAGSIYNFTKWRVEFEASGDGFHVIVDGAGPYPDAARFAAEGFLHYTTERITSRTAQVRSERSSPDRVVFFVDAS